MQRLWRRLIGIGLIVGIGASILSFYGCAPRYDRRDPTGEVFPSVVGTSLEKQKVQLPEAFAGQPVLFIVGYKMDSQFDIDRWLLGLYFADVSIEVREIPTLPGMVVGWFEKTIDDGMRSGIPQEDWGAVITVYDDAEKIAKFTGNKEGLPGRVLLLDGEGRVVFFHDRGFSVTILQQLLDAIEELTGSDVENALPVLEDDTGTS